MDYTVSQAALSLAVPINTVKYRIKTGKMKARTTPYGPMIPQSEITKYRRERVRRGLVRCPTCRRIGPVE